MQIPGADGNSPAKAAALVDDNTARLAEIANGGYSTATVKSFNTEWNSSYSGQDYLDELLRVGRRAGYPIVGCINEEFALLLVEDPSSPVSEGEEVSDYLLAHVKAVQAAISRGIRPYLKGFTCPIGVLPQVRW